MAAYSSHARLRIRRPSSVMAAIYEDLTGRLPQPAGKHGEVQIDFAGGSARLSAVPKHLVLTVEAAELELLDNIKDVIAGQLVDRGIDGAADLVWDGCEGGDRRPASFREMRVHRVAEVTPRMRRITLKGENLERFSGGDLHLRLLLPPQGVTVPEWPVIGPNGLPKWPSSTLRPVLRTYTARRVDVAAGEMDIDLVMHEGKSIAADWAARAQPGDVVGIIGPEGGRVGDAEWYLLAGDETALPAIARTLESLPADKRGVAIVEVADKHEIQQLAHPVGIDLRWLLRRGEDSPGARLLDAVRSIELPEAGTLFVWTASEYSSFRALRRHSREERGLTPDQHLVAAYWRRTTPTG